MAVKEWEWVEVEAVAVAVGEMAMDQVEHICEKKVEVVATSIEEIARGSSPSADSRSLTLFEILSAEYGVLSLVGSHVD